MKGPDQFRRARELFTAARALPPPDRAAWVAEQTQHDSALREEVMSLLAHDTEDADGHPDGDFLSAPPIKIDLTSLVGNATGPSAGEAPVPAAIGKYRIIRLIGAGGMGVVYEAEQPQPRRLVALKVIRSVRFTSSLLHRFEHEAELLARLEHPGIARIYEAGTFQDEDRAGHRAQPFFAMELVRGEPLTEYARRKQLTMRDRLELLARICDAVQHAHQRGVIHRDLKPANILVTEEGQPKILDFGVARAAGEDAAPSASATHTGQIVGTLSYMSPEQAAGDARSIDTRSDVYSLGVIAYELLAGRLPHAVSELPIPQAVRTICESPPQRLSSIQWTLRGDIETIVAKALEQEKDRRYASASGFAADLRRYLNNEPISARPASTWYHASRFARRNKALVGGMLATFLALVAGIAATTYQFVRARAAEARAERRADFLVRSLRNIDPTVGVEGRIDAREFFDKIIAAARTELADQPDVQAQVFDSVGRLLVDWGQVQQAQPLLLDVARHHTRAYGPDDLRTAMALTNLADAQSRIGQFAEAEASLRSAISVMRRELGPTHTRTLTALNNLAFALKGQKRLEDSAALFQEILAARQSVEGDEDLEPGVANNLADAMYALKRFDEARTHAQAAVDQARQLARQGRPDPELPAYLTTLGQALAALHDPAAGDAFLQALALRRQAIGDDNPRTWQALANAVFYLFNTRQFEAALPHAQRLYEARGSNPLGPATPVGAAFYGLILAELGRNDEAQEPLRRAWELFVAADATNTSFAQRVKKALAE